MALEKLEPDDREVLYELFALGLLEAEEMAELRARLEAGDAETVTGVRRALELTSALAYVAPEGKPAASLRRRLMLAAGAPERSRGWGWMAALAAVCVVMGVLVINLRDDVERRQSRIAALEERLRASESLAAQARDLYEFLREPGTVTVKFGSEQPAPPKGQIFVNREKGVLLVAANLPVMPAGKIFEMWLVPKGGGAPVPAGLFRSEQGQGVHLRRGPVDVGNVAAVAVTLEPEAGSTTPTLPILFAAPIPAE